MSALRMLVVAAVAISGWRAFAQSGAASAHKAGAWPGVLDEHPSIAYATRPTTDRVAKLQRRLAAGTQSLERDAQTGFLRPVLDALGVPVESQLLVFSKTGVQRAYTTPRTPRALYFDESVVVGYIPGAPLIEVAAHDPLQGVVFYTVDQSAASPTFTRQTSCLSCHVSASTLDVPGILVRSNSVRDDGNVMPRTGSNDVTHRTPHPDRWGGWFVTADATSVPYAQRAHSGNLTFEGEGITSNQVFVDWLNSAPETRGYLSPTSDIVTLLAFDHQMHAINLLTRLNWESRIAAANGAADVADGAVRALVTELADYLLFAGEASLPVPLTALPGFAERLAARMPKDRQGRSLAQLDLTTRLLRYPCSYMIYTDAFDALAPAVKQAVYARMLETLAGRQPAILEILRETKPDFPRTIVTPATPAAGSRGY
jgi:hypothetical protein